MDDYYKSYDDADYSNVLNKYEFRQNKKSKSVYQESIQLILKNYISKFTPYDNVLLYHDVGVGKTCSAITIAEGFKEYVTKMNKRIVVLVKNQNIEKNFINELLSDCTMGYYSIISEDEQNKLRRFINKTYNILTYGTFVNRVLGTKVATEKGRKDDRKESSNAIVNLNNTIIIVDEVHNITNNDTYKALYKVLNNSFNYRLVLLTATPIFDNPKEIVEISNLLNIKERSKLLPIRNELFDKKRKNPIMYTLDIDYLKLKTPITYITEYGKKKLTNALKGKISYISSNIETNPRKIEMGKQLLKKEGSKNVIYCEMSDYQYKIYKVALKLDLHETRETGTGVDLEKILANENMDVSEDSENLKSSSLYKNCSDASTMVYPNELFGREGFALLSNDKSILKLPELEKYSSKLATLLKNIQKSPGNIFIYSNYVSNGGVNLVKEMLLQNGFKKFSQNNPNPNSFIIFDEQTHAEKRDKLRKIFNSEQNKHGDIIKIIIGSPIISEGITLKNVRQVHILEPTWNMSKINQIIGRAVRNYSHNDLPKEERTVQIYKYVSVYSKDTNGMFIDKEKYTLSEEKDRSNKIIERLLKQISFDCFIHKDRNNAYYNQFQKNSAECDYQECAMQCTTVPPNQTALSKVTYNINIKNFENYAINYVKNNLRDMFEEYFIWNLDDIIDRIKSIDETISLEVIYTALDELVSNKSLLLDRYGREGHIICKGDYYIFNPTNVDIDSSIYAKIFDFSTFTNNIPLLDYINKEKGVSKKTEEKEKVVVQKELTKEEIAFNNKIKEKYQIYGTFRNKENVADDKFRIVDTRKLTKEELSDQRKKITGKACSSFSNEDLQDIVKSLNIKDEDIISLLNMKVDQKSQNLIQKIKNKDFCKLLNLYLQKIDRIMK